MKNRQHTLLLGLSLSLATACGGPLTEEVTTTDVTLARLEIGTNTIEFLENSAGGISITEQTPAGPEEHFITHSMSEKTALEMYLALAPVEVAVPKKLLELHEEESGSPKDMEERPVVERLETALVIEEQGSTVELSGDGEFASQTSAVYGQGLGSCGSDGGNFFAYRYCGRNNSGEKCRATYNGGNSVWFDNTVTSGNSRIKRTLTITAACNVLGRVEQKYYNLFGGVSTNEASDVWTVPWHYVKSRLDVGRSKRRRLVNARRVAGSGGVRTVSVFTNAHVIPEIVR